MSATITKLSEYEFFKGSHGGVSSRVGWDSGVIRFIRYKFTAPAEGANSFSIKKTSIGLADGTAMGLRFFVSTDPDLANLLSDEYASTGWELTGSQSGGYYSFTGAADVLLLPNTDYYLYIFPGVKVYGMYSWNYASTITVDLVGAAGIIRVCDGDQDLITIPIVKDGDKFVQLAATIKIDGDLIFCA